MAEDPFQKAFAPEGEDPFAVRQALIQSPETMATVVHAIVRDKYGDEAYGWDPLTVAMEIKADFGVDPCPEFMDRWGAIQTLMSGDSFFTRIDAFLAVCNSFSDGDPFFADFNPVTLEEAAWGVLEAGMNRDMLPFSPTIRSYVRIVAESNGFGGDSMPPALKPVFDGGDATMKDIEAGLVSEENGQALRTYLNEQANDVASQFDSIRDLRNVDDELLRKGLARALSEDKDGDFEQK